jgi:hypothetical protein
MNSLRMEAVLRFRSFHWLFDIVELELFVNSATENCYASSLASST